MALWNVRMLVHANCPVGDDWKMVKAIGPQNAATAYLRTSPYEFGNGTLAKVQVAEDGFVGEPYDYDVHAYFDRDTRLQFRLELDD